MDRMPGARGLEEVLRRATADAAFRAKLVATREQAAREAGIELTPAEVTVLRTVPAAQLEALGGATRRRRSLLETAASAAVVLGTVGFAACGGARAQMPPPHALEPAPTQAPEGAAESGAEDAGAAPAPAPALTGAQK